MNCKGSLREREAVDDSSCKNNACKQLEGEQRLAAKVLENIMSGVILLDHTGNILWVNPVFTEITGYLPEEAAKNPNFLRQVGFSDALLSEIACSCELKDEWRGELWCRKGNGEPFLVGLTVNALCYKEKKQERQYMVIFGDITAKERIRKRQQQLKERETRMRKLTTLSAMSAGIAHEINQPLNVIKLLADGALYWYKKGVNQDQEKIIDVLEKISEQVNRIDDIIKHMRSFASLGERDLVPCSINEAVRNALRLLGSQLSAHGISFTKELAEVLPPVSGSPHRLEEVVINLLVNAMQALDIKNPPDKKIVCATWQDAEMVVLDVSDNASGISEDVQKHLFEPFFTTKPGEGMGLGLSLAQSIVESYGGRITAFNNTTSGATLRVELPMLEAPKGGAKHENPTGG